MIMHILSNTGHLDKKRYELEDLWDTTQSKADTSSEAFLTSTPVLTCTSKLGATIDSWQSNAMSSNVKRAKI